MDVREERIEPAGVPARVYDPGGGKGVLLLGHGGGQSKDSDRFVRLCRRYAGETGLAVVCIDAVDHGERKPEGPVDPGVPAGWHSRVASQMVTDWATASAAVPSLGPAVAYVGFSMGAIFGFPTVAAMETIRAAVFVVGGVPAAGWVDDPSLSALLAEAANGVRADVLMVNMSRDELFSAAGVVELFNALPKPRKRLTFWDGGHDDWPEEAIGDTISFVNETLNNHG